MNRFPSGARVCFVGDSITCANVYLSHIVSYYRRNFSDAGVKFYNCGVAGGEIINSINTYESDIALYSPTHIVLTIGVNDSCRTELQNPASEQRYAVLKGAYEAFGQNVQRFYSMLKERGAELIICTPPPYAEYQQNAENPLRGGSALMLGYAEFFRSFARENSLPLCDYHQKMTEIMQREQIFNSDCVHPNEQGYYYMAKIFLDFQGLTLDSEEIDPSLSEWRRNVAGLRQIKTYEYIAMPTEQHLYTSEKRFEKIKERSAKIEKYNPNMAIFLRDNIDTYLENKPHEKEYLSFVKGFMEK